MVNVFARLSELFATLDIYLHGKTVKGELPVGPGHDPIFDSIKENYTKIAALITEPTNPEGVKERITELDTLVTQMFLSVQTAQSVSEYVPTLNRTGTANFFLGYLEARGILDVIRGTVRPFIDANINRQFNYALNEQFKNVLPDIGTLMRLRDIGRYEDSLFKLEGTRLSGIKEDTLELMRKAGHQEPTLDDIVTYNLRHPEKTISLDDKGDLLGLDLERYADVLLERRYNDIPILFARILADLGEIDAAQAKKIALLSRYRDTPNIRPDISDADLVVKALFGRRTAAYYQQVLLTTRRKYVLGLVSDDAILAAAQTYIHDMLGQQAWIEATRNLRDIYTQKAKTFPPALLIQMLDVGAVDSDFADNQIDSYIDYTDAQKKALKNYVASKVKPKPTGP